MNLHYIICRRETLTDAHNMKIKCCFVALLLNTIIFVSCTVQRNIPFVPVPDGNFFAISRSIEIELNDIIQTQGGSGVRFLPQWLQSYITGGIEAVENMDAYSQKYIFIRSNRGENFNILNRWSSFFSVEQNFAPLAAARIERRMILPAVLYPDDEYGRFFERLIKNAFNAEYPGAVREDTFWIRVRNDNASGADIYMFFILISIDRMQMQSIITEMIEKTIADVMPTGRRPFARRGSQNIEAAQAAAVNNLRRTFFEGF